MLKKVIMIGIVILVIFGTISTYAITGEEVLQSDQATELVEMKEKTKQSTEEYIEKYGSTTYGITAYILNGIELTTCNEETKSLMIESGVSDESFEKEIKPEIDAYYKAKDLIDKGYCNDLRGL